MRNINLLTQRKEKRIERRKRLRQILKKIWTEAKFVAKIIAFLFILEVVFIAHEFGHLREFQKRNVPIKEVSLGIGPVLFQYQTQSLMNVSIRLIPIMAYVLPTDDGFKAFKEQATFWDKFVVYTAGVRNNFLVGLMMLIVYQFIGWRRGRLSTKELVKTVLITPVKIVGGLFAVLIYCITWNRVNLTDKVLLSTGGIKPTFWLKLFIAINLTLGMINAAPIPPLDGGRVLEAVWQAAGADLNLSDTIPRVVSFILFFFFLIIANKSNFNILEIDREKDNLAKV